MVGGVNLCFVKIEFGEIDGFYMADCVNLYRKYLRKYQAILNCLLMINVHQSITCSPRSIKIGLGRRLTLGNNNYE